METQEIEQINEWDEYKKISSMSNEDLLSMGCTHAQINEIRKFKYDDEIRKRAKLDNEVLRSYGYTSEEIVLLRQAASMKKIPENVMRDISTSTMTSILRYQSNGSRIEAGSTMYYVNMKFSWSWSRIPFFTIVDMVAVVFASSTGSQFTYYSRASDKVYCNLSPIYSNGSTNSQTVSWVYSTSKPNSISASFVLGLKDSNGNLTHFAYSGYGTFQLTNRSNKSRLYIDASYGHTTINITPSYSLSGSGLSIGIKFRLGMDEQHCTGYFYENFTISIAYVYHGTVFGKNGTGGTV